MSAKRASFKPYDKPRDFATFEPYPQLPSLPRQQLDQWMAAARVQPISAVEWDWSEAWQVGPRIVNYSMWFWFESGHGWGWVGDEKRRFRIREGDLMLIPQDAPHAVGQDEGEHMHVIAVRFYAQVYGGINLLDLLGFPAHLVGADGTPYRDASKRLAREFAVKAPGWVPAMTAEIIGVLLYILRHAGDDFYAPGGGLAHPELPRLLPALEAIAQNLGDPTLAVSRLAEKVYLSETQFRRVFRRVTGMSPVRFIQRQRIERACALLRTTELGVERVAEMCGFADAPFFNRVFKMWTKTSPRLYRRTVEL